MQTEMPLRIASLRSSGRVRVSTGVTRLLPFILFAFLITSILSASGLCASDWKPVLKQIPLDKPVDTRRIMSAGKFGGPLFPSAHLSSERCVEPKYGFRAFAEIMNRWNQHDYRSAAEQLVRFIETYPESPWRYDSILHVGCEAYYTGRYDVARRYFRQVLHEVGTRSGELSRKLASKALARLANVAEGNLEDATTYLTRLQSGSPRWRDRIYSGHWIQRLSRMKHQQRALKQCGVMAVNALLANTPGNTGRSFRVAATDPRGFSVAQIVELGERAGLTLVPRRITTGEIVSLTLPAIFYLSLEANADSRHFWILEDYSDGRMSFLDPQTGRRFDQTTGSSGLLIPGN